MENEYLPDLISDLKNRIQRSHRLLEYHRHEVSAKMLHHILRCLCDVIYLIAGI